MKQVEENLNKTHRNLTNLENILNKLKVWRFKKPDKKMQIIKADEIINEGVIEIIKKLQDVI